MELSAFLLAGSLLPQSSPWQTLRWLQNCHQTFDERFSKGTAMETTVDLIVACYWPRIKLLQWCHDKRIDLLSIRIFDFNFGQQVTWLCYWLQDEHLSVYQRQESGLGKNDHEGIIMCLFELSLRQGDILCCT
jgi:hypothetical protein